MAKIWVISKETQTACYDEILFEEDLNLVDLVEDLMKDLVNPQESSGASTRVPLVFSFCR